MSIDKILKTIIIIVVIIAVAYVVPRLSCEAKFADDPIVQVPDYNDYRPEFRIVFDSN